jgi:large subunit ribosomal protein L19
MHRLLKQVEEACFRTSDSRKLKELTFNIGDTVDVHTRILEGDKERIQIFSGVVLARRGSGTREMFTVRRIVAGEGVERTFPMHSPKVADVVVKRHARVRRAKLYFLRERIGKATRLVERRAKEGEAAID